MEKIKISLSPISKILPFIFAFIFAELSLAMPDGEIRKIQAGLRGQTTGEKIALFAEKFVGTPYDEDPQGEYVSKAAIVADERVDCMYLTFRSVELALSHTPEEAIGIALEKRFHSRGIVKDGRVLNYDDRFQYGEDMIQSGKWGREITSEIGRTIQIQGSRGRDFWEILPPGEIKQGMKKIKSGDILFFFAPPEKRKVKEGVAHIGFIKIDARPGGKKIYLIHASGTKNKGGAVKKVPLKDYLFKMPFVGVKVTRFE